MATKHYANIGVGGILSLMKTALRALVLVVVVSGIAGIYFLFGPEHAPAGATSAFDVTDQSVIL